MSEAYLEPCQTCKMECFVKIVNDFAKLPILILIVDVTLLGRLVPMQKEQIKKIFLSSSKTDSPSQAGIYGCKTNKLLGFS